MGYYTDLMEKIVNLSNSSENKNNFSIRAQIQDMVHEWLNRLSNVSKPNSFYNSTIKLQETSVIYMSLNILGNICLLLSLVCSVGLLIRFITLLFILYTFLILIVGLINLIQLYLNVISYKPAGVSIFFYAGCRVHFLLMLLQLLTAFCFKFYLGWTHLGPLLSYMSSGC